MLIVLTTVSSIEESEALAAKIVRANLAACVQILPKMTSIYIWEGEMQRDTEHLILIKTLTEKYDDLERFITANHSYEVPEIVAIDAERVSESYLAWMNNLLR